MKKAKNVVIIFDITTDESRVIATQNKSGIIDTILTKIDNEHEIRISSANFDTDSLVTKS